MNDLSMDFVQIIDRISDGELDVNTMHDAYSNQHGYIDCADLTKLREAASSLNDLIAYAERVREAQ